MSKDDIIECPCYRICSALGIESGRWCSYHTAELPPPGTWRFNPKEEWCPPGVQANVMMLSSLLPQGSVKPETLEAALLKVREAIQDLRNSPAGYHP